MSTFTKEQEQYIEHEVKIRLNDEKFQIIEKDFHEVKTSIKHLDNKLISSIKHLDDKFDSSIRHFDTKFDSQFKWIVGIFASSIIVPVVLHISNII